LAIFGAGTLLTRGAGCTINDIWDRDLDAKVERCKNRPLPAGEITLFQAQAFFVAQMTAAFGLLCLLNPTAFFLGLAAPIPMMVYPLVKRMGLPEIFKHSKLRARISKIYFGKYIGRSGLISKTMYSKGRISGQHNIFGQILPIFGHISA